MPYSSRSAVDSRHVSEARVVGSYSICGVLNRI
jgi:hypothetical protein